MVIVYSIFKLYVLKEVLSLYLLANTNILSDFATYFDFLKTRQIRQFSERSVEDRIYTTTTILTISRLFLDC